MIGAKIAAERTHDGLMKTDAKRATNACLSGSFITP